jgi:hypothetical protein
MLHRQKRVDSQNQSSDDKTVEEATVGDRCAIPREIFNDISIIASAQKKNNCEVQIEALTEWTEAKKLQNECAQLEANGIQDDKCKYVIKPK